MRLGLVAALLAFNAAASWVLTPLARPGSAGFVLTWLMTYALVGAGTLFAAGLVGRTYSHAHHFAAAYVGTAPAALAALWFLFWKGSWDFLLIAALTAVLHCSAVFAGARLRMPA